MTIRFVPWLKIDWWCKWAPMGLWALTLVGLPLTSFPLLTQLTGAIVAPFSTIPLVVLGVIWFVPYLLKRGILPRETVPFLVFSVFVIALAAFSFFQVEGSFRDKPLSSQTVRTFIPFGSGLVFYLVSSAWHKDSLTLKRSLQFISIGGILSLVWSVSQAVIVNFYDWQYPPIMIVIKSILVSQSNMDGNPRLAGLTWEASWFAHQLNMLYLPLWLAASYQRTSVFPKLWKISVENICLFVGVIVFFLSSPRIGGAAFMLMLLFIFIKFNLAAYHWIMSRLTQLINRSGLIRIGVAIMVIIMAIGIYTMFSAVVLNVAGKRDWRVGLLMGSPLSQREIQQLSALDENSLFYVGMRFAFLERTVYWMDGWRIFNDNPLLGVGLGNAGYYFVSHLPAVGWSSYEIRSVVYRNDGLPNIKSIWFRLLAETGIIGFSLFITWLIVLWASTNMSFRSQDSTIKTIALAGQLALLAYVFEGFSVDTFGLPYLFVIAGLASSARLISRRQTMQQTVNTGGIG